MSDKEYNGWTNFETWLANMEYAADWSDAEDKDGRKYKSVDEIATAMRDTFMEVLEDGCGSKYAMQWVTLATDRINWTEIATANDFLLETDDASDDDEPPDNSGGVRQYSITIRLHSGTEVRDHHYMSTGSRLSMTTDPDIARTWFALAAATVLSAGGVSRPMSSIDPLKWPTVELPTDGLITSVMCDMPNGDQMEIRLIGYGGVYAS